MNTPIRDFAQRYARQGGARLHMPGHKGVGEGNALDITEIAGADELYHPHGIILESEQNAAALFGAARTVYSTEGSSLCIRAMLYLALMNAPATGRRPYILAGRNAHKTLMTAAGLLDMEIEWLYGADLISCPVTAEQVDAALAARADPPAAVYLTTPDYLGHRVDTAAIAAACHRRGVPLLVDNAHGAYLRFADGSHPLDAGADLCCDSAHKTLPVLTGGAYLHVGPHAPEAFARQADRAMALFASTSPSYLILQSLDGCNAYLADGYRERLRAFMGEVEDVKTALRGHGFTLMGDEPLKITIAAKAAGYTGEALHQHLRQRNIECEFSDPDFLTMMLTPETGAAQLNQAREALLSLPLLPPIKTPLPPLPRPRRRMTIREAMLAHPRQAPIAEAAGHILADAHASCPPAVPVAVCGEEIDPAVIACFRYYGIESCWIVDES
ncbi:MAG: amino acid decarboxylase [Clostridia bacterium]|nr:amino acid decarboxylase [Clostridia bacterium]